MSKSFQRIALFGQRHRQEKIAKTLHELARLLKQLKRDVVVEQQTAQFFNEYSLPQVAANQLKKQADLMIVVGGDGSLLQAARIAVDQQLPVLGINRGRLGFLTDIGPSQLKLVEEVLAGDYVEEKRFLLEASTQKQIALNDIVLLPGDVAHMIEFAIYIDEQLVCTQRADGLIIATPTGSTAYALSGGGPILHPQLDAIVLVPMFPHTLSSRPIVVSSESNIKIVIAKNNESSPRLSCDGGERIAIKPGETIEINKKKKQLQLIHPKNYEYFATLRSKLQWESRPY